VALVIGGTPFFESWPHGREKLSCCELRNLGAAALDENSQHDREKYTGYNLDEESFPAFRVAPWRKQAASVLQLPLHTIYSSQTQLGDQLVICVANEMEHQLRITELRLTEQVK